METRRKKGRYPDQESNKESNKESKRANFE